MIWLAILFATTAVAHSLSPEHLHVVLGNRSTNLHHLAEDPLRVLLLSALWIDGGLWVSYLFLYNIFHVPAERWLGTLRWLWVVAVAHVGATYISEGVLYMAIRDGVARPSAVNTLDVGVSYALAGVVGVLTYRIATPWRYVYLLGALGWYGLGFVGRITFTDIGHFTALLLGLACYPLTRANREVWDPVETLKSWFEHTGTSGQEQH
ncbi:hypothetical protein FOS14_03535 [Skermania sp. ID1734]|nr:rhomboid-like protein [Skermania sp. ID1734]TSE01722.1 hypothetical protein FOS14_03535 [Skermania sp. ID1734]